MNTAADTTLILDRTFAAPVAAVYRAWTSAEGLERWYAPVDGWVTEVFELDVRPGGRYHLAFGPPEGGRYAEQGVYREVEPEARLVYTMILTGPDGTVECETVVTVEFLATDDGTRVNLVEEGYPTPAIRDHHQAGWARFLDRLERSLLG